MCFFNYLTGLIEGDGCIVVPKNERTISNRLLYGKVEICFNGKDLPLALRIQCNIPYTTSLLKKKGVNCYMLVLSNKDAVLFLLKNLNGRFYTPKLYQFNCLIDWFNEKHGTSIVKKGFNTLPIYETSWLSGFIEADGCFYIRNSEHKKSINFYLEQTAVNKQVGESNKIFLLKICKFLNTDLKLVRNGTILRLRTNSFESNNILISYLNRYPLFGKKYLDYLDWKCIYNKYLKKIATTEDFTLIKLGMNDFRTEFNWNHLKDFYTYKI